MPKKIDDDTREIINSFVSEGYERLDDSETQLSRLGNGDDAGKLHSVFRLFHSVKGSAGYLGFENIKHLTHEAETLLEAFLKEKFAMTQESLDVIFATIDSLRGMIAVIEKEFTDEGLEDEASARSNAIAAHLASLKEAREAEELAKPVPNEIQLSELVTADMARRFIEECADLVDRAEKMLLGMTVGKKNVEALNDVFRAVHTIKGNAGFFAHAALERACMELESSLDTERKKDAATAETFVSSTLRAVDRLRGILNAVVIREAAAKADAAASKADAVASKADAADGNSAEYRPIGEILVDMGAVKEEHLNEALAEQERPIGEILVQKGVVNPDAVAEALKIQQSATALEATPEVVRREIRVDTGKLDKLFELVGELITAESMVANSPDLVGLHLDSFNKSISSLSKISREIQETTMMIRMIPLEGLFQKMTRLVRDLSRKFGKPVNLLVSGQDTEMDKNVIEQVADPLVHILRNAIDHGIEGKEARLAAGKPETGTIKLSAKYEGSEIWISVSDDGGGLDRERILKKATALGLAKEGDAAIPDRDVWGFIFEPGFSTAEKVSDVSGRGVGLDVVKRNIERIRGRVEIDTSPGTGTEFTLAIPLTMAIVDGITVRVGGSRYSLPLGDIIEFAKISDSQVVETEGGGHAVNIRDEFFPLIKLHESFGVDGAVTAPEDGIVIVVQNDGRKACVLIDEVVGNQQIVVKSISEFIGKIDGISGCSILGDGGVSFIIDTAHLLSRYLA